MKGKNIQTTAFESLIAIGVLLTMTTLATSGGKPTPQTTIVNPSGLDNPAPNGYSHVVIASDATRIAFIAGQGGEDPSGRLSSEFSEQLDQAYANLRTALDAVGAEPDQVTKITTYVVDYDQSKLELMAEAVAGMFGEALPAQTLVPVPRLAIDGMLFEVDAVAVLD